MKTETNSDNLGIVEDFNKQVELLLSTTRNAPALEQLLPFSEGIKKLRENNVQFKIINQIIEKHAKIKISDQTLRRFCREILKLEIKRERIAKYKKNTTKEV